MIQEGGQFVFGVMFQQKDQVGVGEKKIKLEKDLSWRDQ